MRLRASFIRKEIKSCYKDATTSSGKDKGRLTWNILWPREVSIGDGFDNKGQTSEQVYNP